MPRVDLKQDYRFTDGRLFRKGRDRDVPQEVADWIGGAKTATGANGGTEAWPEGFPYADLYQAKFKDAAAVRNASDEELLAVDGIGPKRVEETRAWELA